jgi:hypothetical protein
MRGPNATLAAFGGCVVPTVSAGNPGVKQGAMGYTFCLMTEMAPASIDAHPRYIVTTDVVVFVLAAVIVIALGRIPRIFSPLALGLAITGVAVLLGLDLLRWHLAGIRSVRLDVNGMVLYRGPRLQETRRERRQFLSLRVKHWPGRRTAIVKFAGSRAVRIPDDAFPREAYGRFLVSLEQWARPRGS